MKKLKAWLLLLALMPAIAGAEAPVVNAEVLHKYLDERIGGLIEKGLIPGATLAVVERGREPILKGYGYADLENRRPVDPETTLFRVGSITKSFIGLAILQMVDEGKLDLKEDANRYLRRVKIPDAFDTPVTVEDLLRHRAGFAADIVRFSADRNDAVAQDASTQQRQLVRVNPPGQLFAYDNVAYGLLGVIASDVDKRSLPELMRERVFKPLGMERSVLGLPDQRRAEAAIGYLQAPGAGYAPGEYELLRDGWQAAGDLSTTAADMAKFLRMLLDNGRTAGGTLLTRERFAQFHDTRYGRFHPQVHGVGLGAYGLGTGRLAGAAYGHGGGIRGFASSYMVLPHEGVAFFVSVNGRGLSPPDIRPSALLEYVRREPSKIDFSTDDLMYAELPQEIANAFLPLDAFGTPANGGAPALNPEGRYVYARANTVASFAARFLTPLILSPVRVSPTADGGLMVGRKGPYRMQATDLYGLRDVPMDTFDQLGFALTPGGAVVHGAHSLALLERLAWHQRPLLNAYPFLLSLLVLICAGAVAAIRSNRYQPGRGPASLAGIGSLLIAVALGLEMEYAVSLGIEGVRWPAWLWRSGLHLGLVLSAVALLRAVRARALGAALLVIPATAIVLSSAAYWGLIGHF